tara:strand:+ start:3395 stop:4189 length:795 start_codon:yes stop_codon:yes gene_type:complete
MNILKNINSTAMNKKQIIKDFISQGIAVIPDYVTKDFCQSAIEEMDIIQKKYSDFVVSKKSENSAGDSRIFKIENKSKSAMLFKKDPFIKDTFNQYCNLKFESHFVLGGIVKSLKDSPTNSGGGWHRDSDEVQLKAMLYLKDVNSLNGPFLFIRNSKNHDLIRRNIKTNESWISKLIRIIKSKDVQLDPRYSDDIVESKINKEEIFEVKGKAGTLVLFDSSYIHRGKNMQEGTRYTLTNYFFKRGKLSKFFRKQQFGKYFLPQQ